MFKIGFDSRLAFHNHYGPGHYSRSTIHYLTRQYSFNNYYLYTSNYKEHALHRFAEYHNIEIKRPKGWWERNLLKLNSSKGLERMARREGLDLWHGLNGELPSWNLPTAMVVTIHNLIHLRCPHFYSDAEIKRAKKISDYAIARADKIVAVSQQTADDIMEFYSLDEDKIEVIHQSCDPQFYKRATEEEIAKVQERYNFPKKFMVAIGTIEERKNVEALVRALPKLPKELHLYAIGKWTPYADKVMETAESLGVAERVVMIHDAQFWQLPAIYSLAEALLYVSMFESFGMPVLEGITYGIPVITSGGSTMMEVAGDSALYVNPDSPTDIADKIELLLSSPTLRETLIERGYNNGRQFKKDKVAEQLYSLYKTILAK